MLRLSLLAPALAAAAVGVPYEALPPYFHVSAERAAAERTVPVIFALKKRALAELHAAATASSTPGHARYGKYLSRDEASALTAPRAADTRAVAAWLKPAAVGAVAADEALGVVRASLSVGKAEALLSTRFHVVRDALTARELVRAAAPYTLPPHVDAVVEAVFGLHGLPLPPAPPQPALGATAGTPAGTPPEVLPAVLASHYQITSHASGSAKVRQAVAEFQGQTMNQTDVSAFFAQYVPDAPADEAKVFKFHGEPAAGGDGIEAMLDIEYIMGAAPGVKTEFYEQMSNDFCSDLKNWTTLLLADADPPLVHSVSYGWQGNLSKIGCAPPLVASIDADYAALAARGITLVISSGDSGSGYAPPMPPAPPKCPRGPGADGVAYVGKPALSFEFKNGLPKPFLTMECCTFASMLHGKAWTASFVYNHSESVMICDVFNEVPAKKVAAKNHTSGHTPSPPPPPPGPKPPRPVQTLWASWPASSPWVTAVGATRFLHDVVGPAEAAVGREDHFGSGGGFSTMWDAPAYQKEAVAAYFSSVDPSTLPDPSVATYPKGGRGTPDVSAIGTGYTLTVKGKPEKGVGGTSASAPVFAAMVSLINDELAAAGKPAVGFMNPLIYANPAAFTDVTVGSDKVGRGGAPLAAGFNCSAGWDPVTGVGSPVYPKLLAAAKAAAGL